MHNALALARASRRKLIMPKLMCWTDRYWNNLEDGRYPTVKASQHPLPFHCPFDHLFDLEKWVHSDVPFREYSFLDNPRVAPADRNDSARLHVRGAADTWTGPARLIEVNAGASYKAAARVVRDSTSAGAYVIKVGDEPCTQPHFSG